jgi:predicted type IV restriction endonuclease
VITDQTNEAVTLEIFDDYGIVEDDHHKLQMGTIVREKFSIHPDDPLCASGEVHWTQTLKRNKWNIRTEIYNSLTSDKQNFYMLAKVEAYEDEKLIFEKDFNEKISRSYH